MATYAPGILARGPWDPESIEVTWRAESFEPAAETTEAADAALAALRARSSPSHDGLAARLASYEVTPGRLALELQPVRWALRLLPGMAARSLAILCLVRSADGSWLAGRRAAWLATWPGRWALGAGGSVELDENPTHAMSRELREEWSVEPERLVVEALVLLDTGLAMLVGQAWLAHQATVSPDAEHDEFAWWPADVSQWPVEADEPLRRMASLLAD
ncbi:MAG TPA: NUDIX domain-containing protein [Solirubrobacteraceae bacterium]|jgi:8-oxo-dGTP pyrophosphatase MutT (NUDIX family)|nr:NUDIX domain-containing protein [Solirubrobacteraceae bacterium]